MADQDIYRVRTTGNYLAVTNAPHRVSGIQVAAEGDTFVENLTAEQLTALKADRFLIVEKVAGSVPVKAKKSKKVVADAVTEA